MKDGMDRGDFFENIDPLRKGCRMHLKTWVAFFIGTIAFLGIASGEATASGAAKTKAVHTIVASDTILSGMIVRILPPSRYRVEAILPPGQCPGHYDLKLSDIEKVKQSDLIVSFRGMSFLDKAGPEGKARLLIDAKGRNWMAPNSYLYGLGILADELSKHFPKDRNEIMGRKRDAIRKVKGGADSLMKKVRQAGVSQRPVIASALQRETMEWMGFRVVGQYGRPEAMSPRDVVRLVKIGREQQAIAVVDNLQSGPEAGRGIAEAIGAPHVVLTNFPSEKGYLATLEENVNAVLAAVGRRSAAIPIRYR
jgi:ABC-type Zn uptake system ZnuABC Zn-binding protein ZnuA